MDTILQRDRARLRVAWFLTFASTLLAPAAHALTLADTPLFLVSAGKANVLVILDNSNSMDEAASGAAVGSNSPESKSEIARGVIKTLITTYTSKINMGLMAYKLNTTSEYYLHNSPYDVSYDPANYDATYAGPRDALTKRFRSINPTSAGDYIHYNIALPYYSTTNDGNLFCYSASADFDNGTETYPGGPWDSYRCFTGKAGTSDGIVSPRPTGGIKAAETALGYSGLYGTFTFSPTDSDLAQGILDFGRHLTSNYVARAWFRNDSPGRGYLHTPIKFLDATQASALNAKLACNIPGTPSPCTASGIQNAGLTPIEGTLYTARDYFKGTWTNASEGYTAACYPLPESCGKNFVVLVTDGLPSTDKDGNTVTVPATALTQAATAAAALKTDKVETYVVGFALPFGTDPATLNTIASSGGTHTAYSASDTASLTTALSTIFLDILTKVSSASSVATNSTQLDTDTKIYQARFDSADWTGQLLAYPIKADGTLDALAWDAGSSSKMPAHGARNITFYKPGTGGADFTWANLTLTQQAALDGDTLGDERVDYLRGSDALEVKNSGTFRNRSRALGDIVNSDPFFVGAESFGNQKLPGTEGSTYASHVTAKGLNPKMVYVGANDGMLHGFDADTGVERLAHVPNAVFPNLKALTSPSYTHRYFVDGSPKAADAYFGGAWHTVLVETLAGGGRAVFALDVTDPTAHAGSKVLWEYTDTDLGYPLGEASVVRMANGEWAAVFGNGYLSDNHHAVLYVVNAQTGALIRKIDTGVGGPAAADQNGLASPTVVDTNGDRIADAAYGGDLKGNMWKFDLTSATPASWDVAYRTGATNRPLFTTEAPDGTVQAITARPAVGRHAEGGVMVLFGTGKYMELSDRIISPSPQVQTFYGIHDEGSRVTGGRSALKEQKVVVEVSEHGYDLRLTTQYEPGPADHGWFIDLPAAGERQVSRPVLRGGRIIFTTLIPSGETCSYGGTSWLMEMDAITGGRLKETPFDLNGDGLFNSDDWATATGDFDGDGTPETVRVPASGKKSKEGIIKTPAIIGAGEKEYKYASGTTGNVEITVEPGGGGTGRQSWRQLQ
ncbi:MAG: pilus assembly protein [Immundisolibacter sp.]|uniref:pilus assembly protein n=1 Tax=Immundisolibacter sp. TaxID=1934948 RepID=UPI003D1230F4